jgi:hypothetical protein
MAPDWIFMKSLLQLLLLLCILAALALWWSPDLRQEADIQARGSGLYSKPVSLYKWRDEQGVWQYTQYPPTGGVPYEEIRARTDINALTQANEPETDD